MPIVATPLGYWPSDFALKGVYALHGAFDLPWWLAVAGATVTVRMVLLPLAFQGTRSQAKMQQIKPELAPLQARIQASGGQDQQAVEEMQAVYAKHGVSVPRMLMLPMLQLPVFMSFFLGMRRLAEAFPDAHAGGAYWFVDLAARDETWMLPAASGLSALALVRLSVPGPLAGMSEAEAQQAELMKKVLSGVTLVSLPVASTMPASVLVFWITNNAFSLLYTSTTLFPPTRAALGLHPMPGPYDPAAAPAMPPPPSSSEPHDAAAVNKAQLATAQTLADVASKMAASGNLAQAVGMQRRALVLLEEVTDPNQRQLRLDAAWQLAELEAQNGKPADAITTIKKWHAAGGDGHAAAIRIVELEKEA